MKTGGAFRVVFLALLLTVNFLVVNAAWPAETSVDASASASTIYATWTSASAASTALACGTKEGSYNLAAVDNGTQTDVTFHSAIVAGLTPNTRYYCLATGDVAEPFQLSTLANPTSTPLTGVTFGRAVEPNPDQIEGDTFYTALSHDGTNYVSADDNKGFGNATSSNALIAKLTGATLIGANVNTLPSLGSLSTCMGDLPARSWKITGLYSLNGTLYAWIARQHSSVCQPYPGANVNTFSSGSIVKSQDGGATWANFQAPASYSSAGAPPSPASALWLDQPTISVIGITAALPGVVTTATPHDIAATGTEIKISGVTPSCYNGTHAATPITSTSFSIDDTTAECGPYVRGGTISTDMLFSAASPVMYGADDGTLGYRVDNADAYIYVVSSDGYTFNGNYLYLARVPRAKIGNLRASDWQFYVGGADGSLDAAWSASAGNMSPILSAPGKVSMTTVQYMPSTGRYVMLEWYYAAPLTTNTVTWTTFEAPHPWGPWTLINTTTWAPEGFYNPTILIGSAIAATPNGKAMTLLFSGDYATCCHAGGFYHLFTASMTLRTH